MFGGYTRETWKGTDGDVLDPTAYLFTLTNPVSLPAKYVSTGKVRSIYRSPGYGPIFCAGWDLFLFYDGRSGTSFNSSQSFIDTTGRGVNTFNGQQNFKLDEVEVWAV